MNDIPSPLRANYDELVRRVIVDKQKIGYFSQEVIEILDLDLYVGMPIYIGLSNVEHIKKRHPYEYEKYFTHIEDIISMPDYVGKNPSDGSIAFVKFYNIGDEYVRVAVKVTTNGVAFVKTLHLLSTVNAERYIKKGTLKPLTINSDKV